MDLINMFYLGPVLAPSSDVTNYLSYLFSKQQRSELYTRLKQKILDVNMR